MRITMTVGEMAPALNKHNSNSLTMCVPTRQRATARALLLLCVFSHLYLAGIKSADRILHASLSTVHNASRIQILARTREVHCTYTCPAVDAAPRVTRIDAFVARTNVHFKAAASLADYKTKYLLNYYMLLLL